MKALIVSDIHANLAALEAVIADCGEVDAIWNLGDTVGYGPRPSECIDRMLELGADPFLAGNHDLASIGALDNSDFTPLARAAALWTRRHLNEEQRARLARLLPKVEWVGYTLAHGSPRSPIWEYLDDASVATANFPHFSTQVCFVGHTHVAMVASSSEDTNDAVVDPLRHNQTIDLSRGRWIINPGSVGQPRDRDPRAAYALLDIDRGTVTAHRVDYDIVTTQRQMIEGGLPEPLVVRLAWGV